jgi:hypothetical protein
MKPLNLEELTSLNFNSELIEKNEAERLEKSEYNHKNNKSWNDTFERWFNRKVFQKARSRARQDKLLFTLTLDGLEKMWEAQNGKCAVDNLPMVWGEDHIRKVSIDQIIPGNGYTLENTWLMCQGYNFMKHDFSLHEFLKLYPHQLTSNLFKSVYNNILANKSLTHNDSIISGFLVDNGL